jgi:hypothetical protein
MVSDEVNEPRTPSADAADACPLQRPRTGRIPALLSLAAVPGAVLVNPLFFGLAGGLLAVISLLLSPAGCRCIGSVALASSIVAGVTGFLLPR